MKRTYLLSLSVLFSFTFCCGDLFAQSCLPDGVTFTTQGQIDSFAINYLNCNTVDGDVTILGDSIVNLNGLSQITSIGGSLNIEFNPVLTSLEGLGNINYTTITSLRISNNANLSYCELPNICIYLENGGSNSIFSNAVGCGSSSELTTSCNETSCILSGITFTTQTEIDEFAVNYLGCKYIVGDLVIEGLTPTEITNLNGLSSIDTITGSLTIRNNTSLTSLSGLENVLSIGSDLEIRNTGLINLAELENINFVGGTINILDNDTLASLAGIEDIQSISADLNISNNSNLINLQALENLRYIMGDFELSSNYNLTSLKGLENLLFTQGNCNIINNNGLTDLIGLESLAYVGNTLYIEGNDNLTSLEGLNNLVNIKGDLRLSSNSSLVSLDALERLRIIIEGLFIENHPSLANIDGLRNLGLIGVSISIINNDALTCLPGWGQLGIEPKGFSITIINNNNLSVCSVYPVCLSLACFAAPPIYNNAPGCNDLFEVSDNCLNFCNIPADYESCIDVQAPTCLAGGITFTTQAEIDNFSTNYPGCVSIMGDVVINGALSVSSLVGLNQIEYIDGNLTISGNEILENLDGLENLKRITGDLNIQNNASLLDVSGLHNVCQIDGSLNIIGNDELITLIGLNVVQIDGIEIGDNPNLVFCETLIPCIDLLQETPNIYNNGANCESAFYSCNILPIELTDFKAEIQGFTVLLTWQTATETNNEGFDIERSKDGTNWEKIAWQDGQGNSSVSQSYRYTDETPLLGTSYYRLKQIDFDGAFSYSEVESVRFEDSNIISLYPNPTKNILYMSNIGEGQNKQIVVYDQAGRTVLKTAQVDNELNVSTLIPGLYMMTVVIEEGVFYGKFVVD